LEGAASQFTVPAHDDHLVFVRFKVRASNYGVAPATVIVEGPVEPTIPSGTGRRVFGGEDEEIKMHGERRSRIEAVSRTVEVTDHFADGISDTVRIDLHTDPLVQRTQGHGKWFVRPNAVAGDIESGIGSAHVGRTEPSYRR
jgi:hypothetical protein